MTERPDNCPWPKSSYWCPTFTTQLRGHYGLTDLLYYMQTWKLLDTWITLNDFTVTGGKTIYKLTWGQLFPSHTAEITSFQSYSVSAILLKCIRYKSGLFAVFPTQTSLRDHSSSPQTNMAERIHLAARASWARQTHTNTSSRCGDVGGICN